MDNEPDKMCCFAWLWTRFCSDLWHKRSSANDELTESKIINQLQGTNVCDGRDSNELMK